MAWDFGSCHFQALPIDFVTEFSPQVLWNVRTRNMDRVVLIGWTAFRSAFRQSCVNYNLCTASLQEQRFLQQELECHESAAAERAKTISYFGCKTMQNLCW